MRYLLILFLLSSQILFAQKSGPIETKLLGNWEGAFIKANTFQKIEVEFSLKEGKLIAFQQMEEWYPNYGEFEVEVQIDSTGTLQMATGYGKAIIKIDSNNLEILGEVQGKSPVLYLHLKKKARVPESDYLTEELKIASGNFKLAGHLHLPKYQTSKTAIILVGGRGCYADDTEHNLYAKFLRQYGIAVLAYQKRGMGNSSGSCEDASIEDFAQDLSAAHSHLAQRKENFEKIGVLGISAGGWVMAKASETTPFDFMISIVGPASSVRDQQIQSAEYGCDLFGLSEQAKNNLLEYTQLLFDAKPTDQEYRRLQKLLATAEKEGWNSLLEKSDIPASAQEMEKLWVRRHNYDPKKALEKFDQPFLAIYGEKDWIVPADENTKLLKSYFKNAPNMLRSQVAYQADHGMEMGSKWINMDGNQSYWHFYRTSPELPILLIDFLDQFDLIEQ